MVKHDLNDLLELLESFGIPIRWHSWIQIPKEELPTDGETGNAIHRFASYFVPQMRFSGADLRAMQYDYTVRITFFYYAYFDEEDDAAFEERFEEACRDYVEYAKTSGYSNEHDMYFSEYTFEFTDLFEEE